MASGAIRFSRNGRTSPLGKLSVPVHGFKVEGAVKEKFDARAAAIGKPARELLRDIYRIVALGPIELKKLHEAEVDAVAGMITGKSDTK